MCGRWRADLIMDKFTIHTGVVMPLDRANIDIDAIIPKQFLKSIRRTGFGPNLFDEWRYLDHGDPGMDNSNRAVNPDFILNQPRYRNGTILLARENFGCGSSREHAVWALLDQGFRAVIAPSFADIFFNNCFKNGVLPIALEAAIVARLFQGVASTTGYTLMVDLPAQQITTSEQDVIEFAVDPFRKDCLIQDLDDIGLTLEHADAIRTYEEKRCGEAPWLFNE
jgi:3-isopropylmalate/(R)-2-methylmalate dehydratase small subunit